MTLARELADIDARQADGSLSRADADRAKDALLRGAASARPPASDRAPLVIGLVSNLMLTLVILGLIAAGAYIFAPLVISAPVMLLCALALPFFWLWEWITGLF